MKFEDFSFHKDLITNLKTSIEDGRIAHAQYFQGSDGSANLALAIAYAHEVMSGGKTDMFGGMDDRVSRLTHPDLHIVFPVIQGKEKTSDHLLVEFKENYLSNPYMLYNHWLDVMGSLNKTPIISVSESEAIYKKLSLKSYEGGYKTLIVWQAEKMNEGCSNKMLKLIEEPPEGTLIILVGSDFNAMLPTIKSRVQKVEIKPLKNLEVKEFLVSKGVDNQSVMDYVMESKGSLGLALQLSDMESDDALLDSFRDLMRIAFQKNVPAAIKWVDESY
jgi:DNA polymerase-3 subunit delta'